jgi:hypothetical protein
LTKQAPKLDRLGQGSTALLDKVSRMLSEWEGGDELAGEFAERLLKFIDSERRNEGAGKSNTTRT